MAGIISLSNILPILTLVGTFMLFYIFIEFIIKKLTKRKTNSMFWTLIEKNFLWFGFIISSVAFLGSLYYSEILGYNVCKLCWIQRIFMYPLLILFIVALFKKEKNLISIQAFVFAIIGLFIAIYHYFLQISFIEDATFCSDVGYSASCSQNFFMHYGYITIPMMSIIAFLLIIVFILIGKSK